MGYLPGTIWLLVGVVLQVQFKTFGVVYFYPP
jgi:carbon starvation protein CstA